MRVVEKCVVLLPNPGTPSSFLFVMNEVNNIVVAGDCTNDKVFQILRANSLIPASKSGNWSSINLGGESL